MRAATPPRNVLTAIALLAGLAPGCVSLQQVSAGHIGCPASEVQVRDVQRDARGKSWEANCKNERYRFACTRSARGVVGCTPISVIRSDARPVSAGRSKAEAARAAPAGSSGAAHAERGYDEARSLHFVRGAFALRDGKSVRVAGAPSQEMGRLTLIAEGYASNGVANCSSLEIVVNAAPTPSAASVQISGGSARIEGRFDFATFRPLAKRFSTFGVRACDQRWEFDEQDLSELRKLLAMYADLAADVPPAPADAPSYPP